MRTTVGVSVRSGAAIPNTFILPTNEAEEVRSSHEVGDTLEEVEKNINEAIEFHLDGMREDGLPIPEATTRVDYAGAGLICV